MPVVLISEFRNGALAFGDASTLPTTGVPVIARCAINDATGTASTVSTAGADLCMAEIDGTGNYSEASTTAGSNGQFKATKIWNAVWNDIADFQLLDDKLEFGRCYFDTTSGAKICNSCCQASVIGIASDTFGFGVGAGNPKNGGKEVPIAVAGWTLAFVDQEYAAGTPLTNDSSGGLTKMGFFQKLFFPERIVALYKKKETAADFGTGDKKVRVNGRHWVKVR
jgi:hypothetical protein